MQPHALLTLIALLALQLGCEEPVTPHAGGPQWSGLGPADGPILFIRNTSEVSEICTMLPDGSDIQVIARYERGDGSIWQGFSWAMWSPDKTQLIVVGGPGQKMDYTPLWLMDSGGELIQNLTSIGRRPRWTHDGAAIIIVRTKGYASDIIKLNVTTTVADTLLWAETGPPGTNSGYIYALLDDFPDDDSRLLLRETYMYNDSLDRLTADDSEILIYDIPDQQKSYLTDDNTEEGWAKVSHDGNYIVYAVQNLDAYPYSDNLFLVTVDGDSVSQLTTGVNAYYSYILWSPDGNYLVFNRLDLPDGDYGYGDLFIFDLQSNAMDTLLARVEEKMSYRLLDWK